MTTETRNPAETYDAQFVPALFAPWGGVLADAACIGAGQRVLDVGCGTGALALAAAERVGASGAVTGIDANAQMLAVARRKAAQWRWVEGRAEALPFGDASFDAVASPFALMFFDDRAAGLREMWRVLRPGGRLAVAVCDAVERSPGYAAFAALQRLFRCGDRGCLSRALRARRCGTAGAALPSRRHRRRRDRRALGPSALRLDRRARVHRARLRLDARRLLDAAQFERLLEASRESLALSCWPTARSPYMPALLITAAKR